MKWLTLKLTRLRPFQVGRIENFKAFSSYNCASEMRADFWIKSPQQKLSDIAPKGRKKSKNVPN